METLPITNPTADAILAAGRFSVRCSLRPFAGVAVDQTIEQTMNKETKTKAGIVGISQSVYKWILSIHQRAAIAQACKDSIS